MNCCSVGSFGTGSELKAVISTQSMFYLNQSFFYFVIETSYTFYCSFIGNISNSRNKGYSQDSITISVVSIACCLLFYNIS